MTRTLFTDGWTFHRGAQDTGTPLRLPHDAMIGEPRSADGGTDGHGGYFAGGLYLYRTTWTAPADAAERTYRLMFEGVYGETRVLVGGTETARNASPYREFSVSLSAVAPGETAEIVVEVDNRAVPNSRWYTGSGIYRPVWLESVAATSIADDGIRVLTRALRSKAGSGVIDAAVDIAVHVAGPVPGGADVTVEFASDGELVARTTAPVTDARISLELSVPDARPWSAEHPYLYDVHVAIASGGRTIDERHERVGLRTIEVDAHRGLRVNGEAVLLRGTAVHHDNGPLGAATFAAAEHRRARLLKEAGYNAIRSAHNPLSRAFLDACDALGLYVMDELTDVWFRRKTPHDEAPRFHEQWRADAASMVAKDRNRPSVILYSLGNEIAESATPGGVEAAQELQRFFTEADPTRPTTIAVNPLLAMMSVRSARGPAADTPPERKPATSTAANQLTARIGRLMVLASLLPAADRATRDVFSVVDIAGYNYAYAGYPGARRRYFDRVIVGTESMPGDLPAIWKRVTSVPGVIGDFGWTGWDYLGEVGIGYWSYGSEPGGIAKPYPGILAGCGVFDITGEPTAMLHLAQAVWGITEDPGIAVRPLDRAGLRPNKTPWLSTDAVSSWSWGDRTGIADVEVYSAADTVELLLNGRSLGRRKAGSRKGYVARFRAPYERGDLVAVAYRHGVEIGRSSLPSAGAPRLRLRGESGALRGPDDLAYVWVELADDAGVVDAGSDDTVVVTVSGPATLAALGSAAPSTEESFVDGVRSTFRGRALAIIRGCGDPGDVTIHVRSNRHGSASLTLTSTNAETNPAAVTAQELS